MNVVLDTRQRVAAWLAANPDSNCKLGDTVPVNNCCPTCFTRHAAGTDEAVECFRNFPPVLRQAVILGAVHCHSCDNAMREETLSGGDRVIMCCNPYCSFSGLLYKPPTVALERYFAP